MYENTLEDFKRWCREHSMPFKIVAKKYYKKGDYYLEANKVKDFMEGDFLGLSLRKYDPKEKTFTYMDNESAWKIFEEDIKTFCRQNGLKED